MPTLTDIKQRLAQSSNQDNPIVARIVALLAEQNWQGRLSAEQVEQLCQTFRLTPVQLALHCIELAACYALTPVSKFNVGAVAIGQSGAFYFGANQEFAGVAMQQTVHAEQSAVSHAWIAGEAGITDVVVNYTPCGHCRQFMNELNSANELKIHLPHSQNNLLHSYLPDDFGPKDLNIDKLLFDEQDQGITVQGDALQCAAIRAMNGSYAPYSQAYSGLAFQAGGEIFYGKYAENAAFNPSFLPLQSALNYYRFSGVEHPIERIVLCEKQAILSHYQMTSMLAKALFELEVEYLAV
ncbi:cytidine deaminase [Bibersteinia trehalosi Y31]|uniref:Cytidine deaminase n=1 Tax=Bibersteinia trehalosi Y31 TaxID=1261658 RepID=A0A179CWV9_BIBTR|nr:cytidine deaminase [Bibersteinia trehalosi]OAQ13841.1 cytidine deaminase [Bibersteinia trehalosi Y31]